MKTLGGGQTPGGKVTAKYLTFTPVTTLNSHSVIAIYVILAPLKLKFLWQLRSFTFVYKKIVPG